MDTRQIRYFLAVVEHGGFGRAAAALNVAQPTMSQSVKALERDVGTALFHRASHGVTLSAAGRAFLGPARLLMRDVAVAGEAVGGRPEHDSLEIVASAPLGAHPGAALVGGFLRAHPGVSVSLDRDTDEALLARVRDGVSELGLVHLPAARQGLCEVELGAHDLVLVFPPPDASRSPGGPHRAGPHSAGSSGGGPRTGGPASNRLASGELTSNRLASGELTSNRPASGELTSNRPASGGPHNSGLAGGRPPDGGLAGGGPHSDEPPADGPHSDGPHSGGPHNGRPHNGGSASGGPQADGPRSDGPPGGSPPGGRPHNGGLPSGGPPVDGLHSGGPHSGGSVSGGPHSGGPPAGGPPASGLHDGGPTGSRVHDRGAHHYGPHDGATQNSATQNSATQNSATQDSAQGNNGTRDEAPENGGPGSGSKAHNGTRRGGGWRAGGVPEVVHLADLAGVDLLGVPRGSASRLLVEAALRAAGVRTRIVVESGQRDLITELVLAGVGAAFMPDVAAHEAAARGAVIRRIMPALRLPYGLVHRSGELSGTARAFIDHALREG